MINNKKVLAITLARSGSKRIPRKNVVMINGKPLLSYTIEEAKKSSYIDRYYVSSDDKGILNIAESYGALTIERPKEMAQDSSTSADSIIHAIQKCGWNPDIVVELMATNPLKTVEDIDGCISKLEETGADSVVSVVRVWDYHPSRVKYIKDDLLKDFYPETKESNRQSLTPPAYIRNGSIYATTTKSLLENRSRLGNIIRPYIVDECRSINIDEPIDLKLAEFFIKTNDK